MSFLKKYLTFIIFSLFFFGFSWPVQAGVCGPLVPNCPNDMCTPCHFFELLSNIINFFVFCLTPPVAFLMIVVSGLYLIFGGSETAKTQGKKALTATIIALVIIYASWLLINTIIHEVAPNMPGSWYSYSCSDSIGGPSSSGGGGSGSGGGGSSGGGTGGGGGSGW